VRQRNAALRGGVSKAQLSGWDRELVVAGEVLTGKREGYVAEFEGALREVVEDLLGLRISVSFRRGWGAEESLEDALLRSQGRDREEGMTSVGPHRADLRFFVQGIPAVDALSRGQAKLFVSGVELAQVKGVVRMGSRVPVVLVDDLPSELDNSNRARFLAVLRNLGGQVFVTGIDQNLVSPDDWDAYAVFHVEQGRVREVV